MNERELARINDRSTQFSPETGSVGMLYQVFGSAKGKSITVKSVASVLEAYRQRFGNNPEAIYLAPEDKKALLSSANVPEDWPHIDEATFLTQGYGYVFMLHNKALASQIYQTNRKAADNPDE